MDKNNLIVMSSLIMEFIISITHSYYIIDIIEYNYSGWLCSPHIKASLEIMLLNCRLKIFVPMMVWGCLVLIPINKTDNELKLYKEANPDFSYGVVDTISIANVHDKSKRLVELMFLNPYGTWGLNYTAI